MARDGESESTEAGESGEGEQAREPEEREAEPTFPFDSSQTLSIMFDAGLPGMPLLGCSGALVRSGVGENDEGLLDLTPEDEADDLDDWIFTEVQNLEESGESRSARELTTLKLVLPQFRGLEFEVKTAWLELPPGQVETDTEESIPMVLKLHSLNATKRCPVLPRTCMPSSRTLKAMRKASAVKNSPPQLGSVAEGDEDEEEEDT